MGPYLTYGQGPMNVETPAHTWVRITRFFEPSDAQTHMCSSVATMSWGSAPNWMARSLRSRPPMFAQPSCHLKLPRWAWNRPLRGVPRNLLATVSCGSAPNVMGSTTPHMFALPHMPPKLTSSRSLQCLRGLAPNGIDGVYDPTTHVRKPHSHLLSLAGGSATRYLPLVGRELRSLPLLGG